MCRMNHFSFSQNALAITHLENLRFFFSFFKKSIDKQKSVCYNIKVDPMGWRSGCGAAGSALPWGGRGRKFKSCHSDQFGGSTEPPIFLYFTGFFGILGACTTSKTSAIFLLKIGSKSGTTTCLTTFVTKKLYSIRVFDTLRFSFYAK